MLQLQAALTPGRLQVSLVVARVRLALVRGVLLALAGAAAVYFGSAAKIPERSLPGRVLRVRVREGFFLAGLALMPGLCLRVASGG